MGQFSLLWGENEFVGKVGYQALRSSAAKRLASSCHINPGRCTPARDEAYAYYFSTTVVGSEAYLYRKALIRREGEGGVRFNANGNRVSLDPGEASRLWVVGDYLYYQELANTPLGGDLTRLYRVLRDGSADPELPLSISGVHFFTEFESFRYFDSGGGFGTHRTGYLLLTDARRLYFWDGGTSATLIRQNVSDIVVLPPDGLSGISPVFSVENTGGEGNAVARLYSLSPASGGASLLKTLSGSHFLEVEAANWPDDSPGRVFLYLADPDLLQGYVNGTCQRQLTQGNYDNWEQFIATDCEGKLKGSREWVYHVHDSKIKGRRSDAPPELIDVEFLGLEVTQGVQSLDHSAIMIAGKPTFVRGYGRLSLNTTTKTGWHTGANLHGFRGGSPFPDSPLTPVEAIQLDIDETLPDQRNLGYSYLFAIPDTDWTSVLAVTIHTRPGHAVLQPGEEPVNVYSNMPLGGRTLAHELGHNYGRRHVDQSGGSCGGGKPAGPYHTPPFSPCTFGDPSNTVSPGAVAGFDVVDRVPVPNQHATIADLMSYGAARWTSVWTWNAIANKLPGAAPSSAPARGSAAGTWILVKGFYDTISGEAHFMPCEILPDGIIPPDRLTRALEAEVEMPEESPIEIWQLGCKGQRPCEPQGDPLRHPPRGGQPASRPALVPAGDPLRGGNDRSRPVSRRRSRGVASAQPPRAAGERQRSGPRRRQRTSSPLLERLGPGWLATGVLGVLQSGQRRQLAVAGEQPGHHRTDAIHPAPAGRRAGEGKGDRL